MKPSVPRLFAGFVCLLGLAGIGLGAHLTRLKFRLLETPCLGLGAGCSIDASLDCGHALADPWSMLFGFPLSLWASSFYAVVAVLGVAIWLRPGALGGLATHALVVLAALGVLPSLLLGIYSFGWLGSVCPFCVGLYGVSVLLLLTSLALHRRLGGALAWSAARRRKGALLDAVFLCSMVFVYSAGTQSLLYQVLRRSADPQAGCPQKFRRPLPATSLVFGAERPAIVLAIFVDPSCAHCKSAYRQVIDLFRDGALEDTQVRVFLFPRTGCSTKAFPGGFPVSSPAARESNACLAAAAAVCADIQRPGAGVDLLQYLYTLHDAPDGRPLFAPEKVALVVHEAGLKFDPDAEDDPFRRCLVEDATLNRVVAHQRYLLDDVWDENTRNRELPVLMLIPVVEGAPALARTRYLPPGTSAAGLSQYIQDLRDGRPGASR